MVIEILGESYEGKGLILRVRTILLRFVCAHPIETSYVISPYLPDGSVCCSLLALQAYSVSIG